MKLKYRLFDKNILFDADFPLKATGFSELFAQDFEAADYVCRVIGCVSLPDFSGRPIFHSAELTVKRTENGIVKVFQDVYSHRELACAVIEDNANELELYVIKGLFDDCFYYWSFLRFDNIFRDSGTLMLHASYILSNDRAILFTAPSGGGKSTQAELWRKHMGARVINGDKAVIRVIDGKAYAYSLPVCGTSGICENEVHEIKCVALVSHGIQNTVKPLLGRTAMLSLISTSFSKCNDTTDLIKVCEILKALSSVTAICSLSCLADESACRCLDKYLSEI